jgi:hypothetical protein
MVVIVGGLASLVLGPPGLIAPAGDPVPDGAIPSRIHDVPSDVDLPMEKDLAVGRVSVAFVASNGRPVVVGATEGSYHLLDLPAFSPDPGVLALSPDGFHLAWSTGERIDSVDLRTGEVAGLVPQYGLGTEVTQMAWTADSASVTYQGVTNDEPVAGSVEFVGPSELAIPVERTLATGLASPSRSIVALASGPDGPSALFVRPADPAERARAGLNSDEGLPVRRPLPRDLYPDGAAIRPLGWATDDLVIAQASAGAGAYAEGEHLVLFTSPDRPKSEWTFRIVARDLPPVPLSIAVDLVPDLDGTSSQQLTHEFPEPDWAKERDISWMIGLGVAGALSVLYGLRWLWRRRTRLH